MDRIVVAAWINEYERVWRTPGTEGLAGLFTKDAVYRQSPYLDPVVGLPAIADMWEDQRNGHDEVFSVSSDVVAVDGETAVVRLQVQYGDPVDQEYRDLWILQFAPDGRCREFEEWPFWPGHGISPDQRDQT
jgi:hypothetical protein